jgi:hypothetical protein
MGMKIPTEAYLPNVNIFHDLPIVTFPSGAVIRDNGPLATFLHDSFGVRKHVDLEIIFAR